MICRMREVCWITCLIKGWRCGVITAVTPDHLSLLLPLTMNRFC